MQWFDAAEEGAPKRRFIHSGVDVLHSIQSIGTPRITLKAA